MKTMIMSLIAAFSLMACSPENTPMTEPEAPEKENPSENKPDATQNPSNMKMNITIDGQTLSASLVENSSTAALIDQLKKGPVTYSAHDYGNFEKVGDLGFSLPQNNTQVTTSPGDIILYQGCNLCLYYAQNSWNFTPMGKINYASETELRNFLKAGKGEITVTLSLPESSAVSSIKADNGKYSKVFRLDGTLAKADTKGIVVQKGKKTLKK